MEPSRLQLYLADLTHTGQIVASNVSPLGIGLLAAYIKRHVDAEIELFKYPKDLEAGLNRGIPRIVGFSNYSWNCELSYKFAEQIKQESPETVIIFGGPNYGLSEGELNDFWKRHPLIDFYVVMEGEVALLHLLLRLRDANFNVAEIKSSADIPGNCHYLGKNGLVKGQLLPRVKDLSQLGSPYLEGLMDKFFDGVLIPMIHTTRGCPFTCAFCSEGNSYYSKVAQRKDLTEELRYIARKRGNISELIVTDANFGMYKEDADKARIIAEIQKEYGWPKRIIVSTGKNQKERVIDVANTLNGAISIAASLQSTDSAVLQNIKRSNISIDALNTIVQQSAQVDSTTYTEIILGLPGDSVEKHTQSLRDVVDAGLGIVRMYQLILLPQTELNTPETRERYGMHTKFRINPRSFGIYQVLGKNVSAVEAEEICVANNTLSYDDYFSCRELDLTVEIIHNTGMFVELLGLCQWIGCSWFDFVLAYHEQRRMLGPKLAALYDRFTSESQARLWGSREELEADVLLNMDRYLNDPAGTNEMAMSKAIAFFDLQEELHAALFSIMKKVLTERGLYDEMLAVYLHELQLFSRLRKEDFINTDADSVGKFHFDFFKIRDAGFNIDPRNCLNANPTKIFFSHSDRQKTLISSYIVQYGKTVDGLGRILMRAPVKTLFRDITDSRDQHSDLAMASFG
jgi:radical SAM superfamily enzyme YgiQ (UPF0313 family)